MAGRQVPVRVLWLTKGLGPGGAERLLVSSAAVADRERFELQAAYLLPWKDHLVAELAARGVPAVCLDRPRESDLRWLGRLRQRLLHRRQVAVRSESDQRSRLLRVAPVIQ